MMIRLDIGALGAGTPPTAAPAGTLLVLVLVLVLVLAVAGAAWLVRR